jgi:hypothetical protein
MDTWQKELKKYKKKSNHHVHCRRRYHHQIVLIVEDLVTAFVLKTVGPLRHRGLLTTYVVVVAIILRSSNLF